MKGLYLFLTFIHLHCFSQFIYKENFTVPMSILGVNVQNPWTGGHIAGQFYTMDLDGTGQEDLVVFDRVTNRLYTYIHTNSGFSFDPRYISFFPPVINWLSIVDYDCDGKKDIFTANDTIGLTDRVKVYRNTSVSTIPSFTVGSHRLLFEGEFANQILDISVRSSEIPAITDIDNDGDIDILVYDLFAGEAINFYRNRSKDKYNNCSKLEYEKYIACWGKFKVRSDCGNLISPIVSCSGFYAKTNMRVEHNGSTVAITDLNGDGLQDILLGDISCTNLVALTNSGTNWSGGHTISNSYFPSQHPVVVPKMPVVSIVDVDGDNLKDMLVTSNSSPVSYSFDASKSIQFYKNVGNATIPSFNFVQSNFLQDKTLDLGYSLYPALADIDADGDLDLICGSARRFQTGNAKYATLILFRNIGDSLTPKFNLENYDYLGLSANNYLSIKPNFADINSDGKLDIYFLIQESSNAKSIKYLTNEAALKQSFAYSIANIQTIILIGNSTLNELDTPIFYDISLDGKPDILHIKSNGGPINYYVDVSTTSSQNFEKKIMQVYGGINNYGYLFGGLDYDFTLKNYIGAITKLDSGKNSTPVLLVSDASGKISFYPNFINEQLNFVTKDTFSLFNSLDNKNYPFRLSAQSTFAAGNLFGDGKTAFIVGESGGGLRLFANKDTKPVEIKPTFLGTNLGINQKPKSEIIQFLIIPNPAYKAISIDKDIKNLVIDFYNATGVLIKSFSLQDYINKSEIDVAELPSGIYFLLIKYDGVIHKHKLQKL